MSTKNFNSFSTNVWTFCCHFKCVSQFLFIVTHCYIYYDSSAVTCRQLYSLTLWQWHDQYMTSTWPVVTIEWAAMWPYIIRVNTKALALMTLSMATLFVFWYYLLVASKERITASMMVSNVDLKQLLIGRLYKACSNIQLTPAMQLSHWQPVSWPRLVADSKWSEFGKTMTWSRRAKARQGKE